MVSDKYRSINCVYKCTLYLLSIFYLFINYNEQCKILIREEIRFAQPGRKVYNFYRNNLDILKKEDGEVMRIIVEEDYESMSKKAALFVAGQIILKPDTVLGLATGSTPLGMYNELIEMYKREEVDFSEVITFNLDEYYHLPHDDLQSYHYFMKENFFKHINIKEENIHIPDGMAFDIEGECREYERAIEASGGIDLQVLGIGENGHIGFNEPAEQLNVYTNLVNLTEETIKVNSRFFSSPEEVPQKAVTVGMGTILKARRILLLANGEKKAEAIRDTVCGYITTQVPSSFLQLHPDVTLILDKAAASLLYSDMI